MACVQTAPGQSCPFAHDSVQLRVPSVTEISPSPQGADLPGAFATGTQRRVLGMFTRYSWPVTGPKGDSSVPDEIARPERIDAYASRNGGLDTSQPNTLPFLERLRRWRIDLTDGLGITSRNHAGRNDGGLPPSVGIYPPNFMSKKPDGSIFWHMLSDLPKNCSAVTMTQVAKVCSVWLQRAK